MDIGSNRFPIQVGPEFVGFADKAIKMFDDEGKVTKTGEVEAAATKVDKLPSSVKRLSNYKDMKFFTLGPIYVTAMVPFDVIEDFKTKLGYTGTRLLLSFQHPIVDNISGWCNLIEGIQVSHFDVLTKFITTQTFLRRDTKELWNCVYQDINILDPFAIDDKPLSSMETASIRVFLPCGNKYRLTIPGYTLVEPTIKLRRDPPLISRLKEAKTVFTTVA